MYFGQIFKSFELLQVNKLDSYAFYKLVRICQLMPVITATQKMQHCYFIVYYWKRMHAEKSLLFTVSSKRNAWT